MIKTAFFALPALPYDRAALEPYLSAQALDFHHGKHHQAYVDKLNDLVAGSPFAESSIETIISKTAGEANYAGLFNNAAQVWNHNFYWNSLSPEGSHKLSGELERKIEINFGGYENFIAKFAQAGMDQFGNGWVWLVKEGGLLKITKTSNAANPLSQGRGTALLALDVWEHAYYLDYQDRRNEYLVNLLSKLINWDFAVENYNKAKDKKLSFPLGVNTP
jgi:superoxide dismutase, Fe-Mn family